MEQRLEPATIASILLTSPTWARLGLAVRGERMRERAAGETAAIIVANVERVEADNPDQLRLAL